MLVLVIVLELVLVVYGIIVTCSLLRLGMLPELVLNQDEKKERFRKCIAKKKQKSEMEEENDADEVEPEAILPTERIKEEVDRYDNSDQDDLDRMAVASTPRIETFLSPICNLERKKIENSIYQNPPSLTGLSSVSQVLPIIRKIVPLSQISQFSLRPVKEEERGGGDAVSTDQGLQGDSWSSKLQLISKDFEAIKYFSEKRSLVISNSEDQFENKTGKRKSVIFHTSQVKNIF